MPEHKTQFAFKGQPENIAQVNMMPNLDKTHIIVYNVGKKRC